jgi:hypothetical protein
MFCKFLRVILNEQYASFPPNFELYFTICPAHRLFLGYRWAYRCLLTTWFRSNWMRS